MAPALSCMWETAWPEPICTGNDILMASEQKCDAVSGYQSAAKALLASFRATVCMSLGGSSLVTLQQVLFKAADDLTCSGNMV